MSIRTQKLVSIEEFPILSEENLITKIESFLNKRRKFLMKKI